jgi:hypothetical protein
MTASHDRSVIPLPKHRLRRVRSGTLHAISLARLSLTVARSHAAHAWDLRVRLTEENDRLRQEIALLREELRIKDARMERVPPLRRPHYPPVERLAILWADHHTGERGPTMWTEKMRVSRRWGRKGLRFRA